MRDPQSGQSGKDLVFLKHHVAIMVVEEARKHRRPSVPGDGVSDLESGGGLRETGGSSDITIHTGWQWDSCRQNTVADS